MSHNLKDARPIQVIAAAIKTIELENGWILVDRITMSELDKLIAAAIAAAELMGPEDEQKAVNMACEEINATRN